MDFDSCAIIFLSISCWLLIYLIFQLEKRQIMMREEIKDQKMKLDEFLAKISPDMARKEKGMWSEASKARMSQKKKEYWANKKASEAQSKAPDFK